MKNRILKFLSSENKTSSQFAEEIGVQPSSVSHILSGRNNPSLDFVLKMLTKYPYISTQWLMFGREPMYSQVVSPTLFDNIPSEDDHVAPEKAVSRTPEPDGGYGSDFGNGSSEASVLAPGSKDESGLERVVMFYKDGTFREYRPIGN